MFNFGEQKADFTGGLLFSQIVNVMTFLITNKIDLAFENNNIVMTI